MADPYLQLLQYAANKTGAGSAAGTDGIAMTLACGGTLFSGQMISASQWAREMAEVIGQGDLAESFRETGDSWDAADSDNVQPDAIEHVYLTKASIIQGAGEMNGSVTWRLRASEVDGWTIGNLSLSHS